MMGWKEPYEFTVVERAFPAHVLDHIPPMEMIPDHFKSEHGGKHTAIEVANLWWMGQLITDDDPRPDFHARPTLLAEIAFWHIQCVLNSFQPKHEHKMAGVAFLIDRFFTKIVRGDDIWLMDPQPGEPAERVDERHNE